MTGPDGPRRPLKARAQPMLPVLFVICLEGGLGAFDKQGPCLTAIKQPVKRDRLEDSLVTAAKWNQAFEETPAQEMKYC